MTFYLGTHLPNWLGFVPYPLCVSRARLWQRKTFPRAVAPWVLDSGAFSQLLSFGTWTVPPAQWAGEARRFSDEIGGMVWCSIQDWMCEETMLARTGLTVAAHQEKTVASYLTLRDLAPDLPWLPVLQGWERDDYLRHRERYLAAGVDLSRGPVGVGSICRRQGTGAAETILRALAGLQLHAFGLKKGGLVQAGEVLASADSLAWSFDARRSAPLPGHGTRHKNCANCPDWALRWRAEVVGLPMQKAFSFA